MKKRLFSGILALCMMLSVFALGVSATEERAEDQCGENMTWSYSDGTLTITGSGEMDDFHGPAPWDAYQNDITKVVLSGSITYIGAYAFDDYDMLTSVDFGPALYQVGIGAFQSCDGLTSISFPATFKVLGEDSFRSCKNLKEIHCAGNPLTFKLNSMWDTYVTIYFPAERPWGVGYVEELEAAFKGRIEFRASDGSDPYVPTEETTEETPEETTEETTVETTEETIYETTEKTVTDTVVSTEQTENESQPVREDETEAPDRPEEEKDEPLMGVLMGLLIILGVLLFVLVGVLIFGAKGNKRGRYSSGGRNRR